MRSAKEGHMAQRFDLATLRDLVGDAVFRRSEDYARTGRVDLLSDGADSSNPYRCSGGNWNPTFSGATLLLPARFRD
jgi:hypothetical protein